MVKMMDSRGGAVVEPLVRWLNMPAAVVSMLCAGSKESRLDDIAGLAQMVHIRDRNPGLGFAFTGKVCCMHVMEYDYQVLGDFRAHRNCCQCLGWHETDTGAQDGAVAWKTPSAARQAVSHPAFLRYDPASL